ncbi:MAG: hypothetical protein ACFBSE_01135 [Prochloraceae cyanobacterium]
MKNLLESLLALAIASINLANFSHNNTNKKNKSELSNSSLSSKQNIFTNKLAIKANNLQISPRFDIGQFITVEVRELDKQTNQIISKQEVNQVKKIRVIIEIGNNQQTDVETTKVQYLIASVFRELWVDEDNLII